MSNRSDELLALAAEAERFMLKLAQLTNSGTVLLRLDRYGSRNECYVETCGVGMQDTTTPAALDRLMCTLRGRTVA